MGLYMSDLIITGSEGLLGDTIARYFEAKGAAVLRCSKSLGHDLEDEAFVQHWFSENPATHLVNLFALNEHIQAQESPSFEDITLESMRRFLDVNVVALFSVCRAYAKFNKSGNIINFSSIYGKVSPQPSLYPGSGHKHIGYVTSKAAVIQLTKYLAVHLAPDIRVNCVIPGGVAHQQSQDFQDKYADLTPMNRMLQRDEITGIVDYLCSQQASYTTGGEFVIDGGYTAC